MKKDKKLAVARVLQLSLISLLVILVLVIFWHFFSHRRPSTVLPLQGDGTISPSVERQEGIEHFDFKGERTIRAKAEQHYAGDSNKFYLEGKVEVREDDKKEGREKIITGDKVAYDKDWQEIVLEGSAKVQFGDLTVESVAFIYHKGTDTLFTDRGASFFSKKVSGRAQKMSCTFRDDFLKLEGDAEFLLRDESESPSPLLVRGDILSYSRREQTGRAQRKEGKVIFFLGKSHGEAEEVEFRLSKDEQFVSRIFLRKEVKTYLVSEKATSPVKGDALLPQGPEREIGAEKLTLTAFSKTNTVQSIEAEGNCSSQSLAPSGKEERVRSDAMRFVFLRNGDLKRFNALGNASMAEMGKDLQLEQLTKGAEISITGQGDRIKVLAGKGGEAKVDSSESEIVAGEITLYPAEEMIDATKDVKVVFKPERGKRESVGFFSNEKPLFILAQGMRFEKKSDRLFLRENIRMWQEKETVGADKMTVQRETGNFSGEGRVRAVFTYLPKKEGAQEERIEAGGDKMAFNAEESLLRFEQNGWLTEKNIRLKAQSIMVYLARKRAGVLMIHAKGKVTVIDEFREGQAEEAAYDLEKETVVLTGNPVVVDKKRGVVDGDKLTFHLGDDRILVENKERDRSTTVIKREK